jgi:hypothetical protein
VFDFQSRIQPSCTLISNLVYGPTPPSMY